MPMISHSGRGIGPWLFCQRCGYPYRAADMRRQLGLILCIYCYDNPIAWYRSLMIQDLLNFTADEELRPADILKDNSSDDITGLSS